MAELTAALKATECEVKAKIKSIRAQYTREKQKSSKVKTGTGTDEVYVLKWPHLEQLKFLDDFIITKKSISNLSVNLSSGCCLVAQVVVVLEVLDLVASYQVILNVFQNLYCLELKKECRHNEHQFEFEENCAGCNRLM
eukprot:Em0008g634a